MSFISLKDSSDTIRKIKVSELVQQKLAQLFLLQLNACSQKAPFTHDKRRQVRNNAQIKHSSWNEKLFWRRQNFVDAN